MWRSQAEAEGLTLLEADNKTGYFSVYHKPGYPKPYQAQVRRGGTMVGLGSFATAEEAALSALSSVSPSASACDRHIGDRRHGATGEVADARPIRSRHAEERGSGRR